MSTETRLRAELRAWADELEPDAGPDVTVASLTDLHHRRLRHRAALVAAAVAVVVAALAVPLLASRPDPRPAPAAPTTLFDLPTRGPLAGDEVFLAGAVRLPWGDDVPSVTTRHVVWAGDVAGGQRWALVAGRNTAVPEDDSGQQADPGAISPVALALFSGPAGAPADGLTLRNVPRGQTADMPYAVQDPATGALLVVAAPGDTIEFSARPVIAADGTESREWAQVAGPDGIAVLQVDPLDVPGAGPVEYRVFRDRLEVESARAPDVLGDSTPTAELTLAPVHGPLLAPDDAQLAAGQLVARVGLAPADVDAGVAWQGQVPGPEDGGTPATVTVATVTAPSGAVLVNVLWSRSLGTDGGYGGSCGEPVVLPAGLPAAERTYAFECTVTDPQGMRPTGTFLVAAPPSATVVRLLGRSGEQVAEATLTDGVVVLPDTATVGQRAAAQVEAFTADGTSLGRTPVLGG